jgi:RNA polymerase sigma factor (sigma-70 family)
MKKELGQARRFGLGRRRPSRAEIDPAALGLLKRHGPQIMQTARRYSATPEDAEDAYQRALEILLTKAPTTSEEDLVPWLRTVVKHEAFAIRRQRERTTPTGGEEPLVETIAPEPPTHERAERYEQLRLGAEALGRLKPQEIRCLLLRAEGYSYKQICEETGWTYTKVNRCLTEGRKAFLDRLAGIESGAECDRLAPLLSALADGEANAQQLKAVRPHLRSCLACRARLKEFRAAPARVAALLPPAALVAGGDAPGRLASVVDSLNAVVQERVAGIAHKAHAATELATGQKVAAVAASAAALAGSGVTAVNELDDAERSRAAGRAGERAARAKPAAATEPSPASIPNPPSQPAPQAVPSPAPTTPTPDRPAPPPPPPPAQAEFAPGAASGSTPPSSSEPSGGGDFAPSGSAPAGRAPAGGGASEFGP